MLQFHNLIAEICKEEKITCHFLSKDWVVLLEKDHKIRFITGYKFDLNGHAFGSIMDDKYAMYEVLVTKNIPVISHSILFRPSNTYAYAKGSNDYLEAQLFFKQNNQNIVIKANNGTCGGEVYHIVQIKDISSCLDRLFVTNFSVSLCPFYHIRNEYRCVVLRDRKVLMYVKRRPVVYGDGVSTIRDLLLEFNPSYFRTRLQSEEYTRVLPLGEKYEYSWQFNLSKGAIPFPVSDKAVCSKLNFLIDRIISELKPGFCSIDIIETFDGEMFVIEFNSGVMMKNYLTFVENGRKIVKDIYKSAIKEMFLDDEN